MYQLSFHFLEIRLRVFYLLLSLILTLITSYYYQFEILYIIGRPFLDLDHKFVLIDLTEAFYTILRICGIISFLIILPFFIYHIWSFYIPSRYNFERKTIKKFSLIFFISLFIELWILYFVFFPKICEFLLSFEIISSESPVEFAVPIQHPVEFGIHLNSIPYQESLNGVPFEQNSFQNKVVDLEENRVVFNSNLTELILNFQEKQLQLEPQIENPIVDLHNKKQLYVNQFNKQLEVIDSSSKSIHGKLPVFLELTARLESYVKLSARFYFIMLTLFQIPFVVIILYYYNLIDCYILCKGRKFFLFSSLLISAFISPPDIISQCVLTFLIFFFYELLIFLGIFLENSFKNKQFNLKNIF